MMQFSLINVIANVSLFSILVGGLNWHKRKYLCKLNKTLPVV